MRNSSWARHNEFDQSYSLNNCIRLNINRANYLLIKKYIRRRSNIKLSEKLWNSSKKYSSSQPCSSPSRLIIQVNEFEFEKNLIIVHKDWAKTVEWPYYNGKRTEIAKTHLVVMTKTPENDLVCKIYRISNYRKIDLKSCNDVKRFVRERKQYFHFLSWIF